MHKGAYAMQIRPRTLGVAALATVCLLIGDLPVDAAGTNTGNFASDASSHTSLAGIPSQIIVNPPSSANAGTLAEMANTTALASPTYHQSSGILPGLR